MNISTNPHQIGRADAPINAQGGIDTQLDKRDQEEALSKAPAILPTPLDVMPVLLGDLFVALNRIKETFSRACDNPTIDKKNLIELQHDIDDISQNVLDLTQTLAKMIL